MLIQNALIFVKLLPGISHRKKRDKKGGEKLRIKKETAL